MLIPAIDATGGIQLASPSAFYEFLDIEDPRYASHHGLVLPQDLSTGFYAVASNTAAFSYKPENMIRGPLHVTAFRGPGNISAFTDELLDWDTGVEAAPARPSRKLSVTLRYVGRSVPRPLEDY